MKKILEGQSCAYAYDSTYGPEDNLKLWLRPSLPNELHELVAVKMT